MTLHSSDLLAVDEGEVFKSVQKSSQADSARPASRQGLWALRERDAWNRGSRVAVGDW